MKSKAVWISCILTALFCGRSANAKVIITLDQMGPNVVATSSGMVDLTDLKPRGQVRCSPTRFATCAAPEIDPSRAFLVLSTLVDFYGSVSGPTSFGSGGLEQASTLTGDGAGIRGIFNGIVVNEIIVPSGYVSDTPIFGTATWDNTTIAALGADVGTFTWTWGTGAHVDSLRLIVTPEPGTLCLLGTSAIGIAGMAGRKFKLGN